MRINQIIIALAATTGFASALKEGQTFKIGVHIVKGNTATNNWKEAAAAPAKFLKADKTLGDKASAVECKLQASTILCDGKAMKTTMVGDMGGTLSFGGTSGSSYHVGADGWIKMSPSKTFFLSPGMGSGVQVENCPHGHVAQHGYPKAYDV